MDRSGVPAAYVTYLHKVRSGTHWQRWKAETIEMLALAPGGRYLDVGCGTGEEVAAMATVLDGGGWAAGIDRSREMVRQANSRNLHPNCHFLAGDAAALPFASGVFSGVRVERTLQHVPDPAAALVEIARVLQPGGRVVALEPDWETLVFSSPLEETGRAIIGHRIMEKPARTVGRHLARLMAGTGLSVEAVSARTVVFTDYESACYATNFERSAEHAISAGVVAQDQVEDWLGSLRAADGTKGFIASVTNFVVLATR